jgi:hypothetical protein
VEARVRWRWAVVLHEKIELGGKMCGYVRSRNRIQGVVCLNGKMDCGVWHRYCKLDIV